MRRKGYATQTATFSTLSEARKWGQITEGAVLDSRHFPVPEAKRHTLTDVIECCTRVVLPHKKRSTIPAQTLHLHWRQTHPGHSLLADITSATLVEHRNILTHGRANATVVRSLAVLSHTFTVAMRQWHMPKYADSIPRLCFLIVRG